MRHFFCRTFLLLAIFGPLFVGAVSKADQPSADQIMNEFPRRIVADAYRYAVDIVKQCPPEDCMVVSVGFTNTLIDAFLRYEMQKKNIESSYLRYWPYRGMTYLNLWNSDDRDHWLDMNFPSVDEAAGKRILLLRTLFHGQTMRGFLPMLRDFLLKRQYDCKVDPYFIVHSRASFNFKILQPYLGHAQLIANDQFFEAVGRRKHVATDDGSYNYSNSIERYYPFLPITIPALASGFWPSSALRENLKSRELDAWVERYVRKVNLSRSIIKTVKSSCRQLLTAS